MVLLATNSTIGKITNGNKWRTSNGAIVVFSTLRVKFSDTRKLCCNHPKTGKKRFYHKVMHPKDADSIANSEDPDQTAPLGAV